MSEVPLYRGTSLISKGLLLGHNTRALPRALWWSWGAGCFLISEVPLYWVVLLIKRRTPLQGYFAHKKHPPPRTTSGP